MIPTKLFLAIVIVVALGVAVGLVLVAPITAQSTSDTRVAGRTFDVWVIQSFAPPGAPPFHDCARFTRTQMCLDGCGDCGSLAEISSGTRGSVWESRVPCGGLALNFVGTSFDGFPTSASSKPVMGASGAGLTEKTTFGMSGVANPNCTIQLLRQSGNPYSRP